MIHQLFKGFFVLGAVGRDLLFGTAAALFAGLRVAGWFAVSGGVALRLALGAVAVLGRAAVLALGLAAVSGLGLSPVLAGL
ncbi:MAG: hypothetical protein AAF907_18345, partial [Planctomycetota bacterium]